MLAEHFDDAALRHGSSLAAWDALFGYLSERAAADRLMIVLDEFPDLSQASPALPSILQKFWDRDWATGRMKLVLAGSYVTAMNRLLEADQPLHGRRTLRMAFRTFDFPDAAAMLSEYDLRDQMLANTMFGNLPGHLALIEPTRSLAETVQRQILHTGGRLLDDAQTAVVPRPDPRPQ